jgi:hypothetical protein
MFKFRVSKLSKAVHFLFVIVKKRLTFASFFDERTGHKSMLYRIQQLSVCLEAGKAALKSSFGDQRTRKILVHGVANAT